MQFKDNKNNFTFSGNINNCSISIGSDVKDKYSSKNHPIKKAINEAEHFIYIISPYISYSKMKL